MSFSASPQGTVTVKTGANNLNFPAGTKIRDIRTKLAMVTNLSPEARAYIGTEELGDDYITQPDQVITFIRKTGEKGLS